MSRCFYCRIDGQMVVGTYPSPLGLLLATGPESALRKLQQAEGRQAWGGWHLPQLAAVHRNVGRANQVVAEFLEMLRPKYAGTRISFPDRVPAWGNDGRRA